jgi:hypothetical protein
MGRINIGRVLLGGLLAGLVLNVGEYLLNEPILGEQWTTTMGSLGLQPVTGSSVIWFVIWNFVFGIGVVWVYAAIRPRFNPGPKTAVIAGLAVWFLVWLLGFGSTVITGLLPASLVMVTVIWGLFEVPIATVAGAWLYREETATT